MHVWSIAQAILLLTLANGAPVIAKKVFGSRLAFPLDAGAVFPDGRPLLGSSKTIRGVVAAILVTAGCAPLLGLDAGVGAAVAGVAMAGDLLSSFIKRRLGFPPSSQALGLDQVPESLFPLLACRTLLALSIVDVFIGAVVFLVGELVLSRIMFSLRIRDEPY